MTTRNRIQPLTEVRARRLRAAISLAEVAIQSGLSSNRVSLIERYPEQARPEELEAHRRAVDELAARRGIAA